MDDVDFNSQQVRLFTSPNVQIVSGGQRFLYNRYCWEVAREQRSPLTSIMCSVELNLYPYPPYRPSWVHCNNYTFYSSRTA